MRWEWESGSGSRSGSCTVAAGREGGGVCREQSWTGVFGRTQEPRYCGIVEGFWALLVWCLGCRFVAGAEQVVGPFT